LDIRNFEIEKADVMPSPLPFLLTLCVVLHRDNRRPESSLAGEVVWYRLPIRAGTSALADTLPEGTTRHAVVEK
jgi:hypothetical protein